MDSNNSGTSGVQIVTRRYLYDKMQVQNLPTINDKLNFLEDYLVDLYGDTSDNIKSLKERLSKFKHCFKERWSNSHRKEETFLKKYEEWLSGTFELPTKAENRPGWPSKSFEDSSERSKRRKTEELRTSFSEDVIVHAANTALQAQGKRDASKILRDITNSPTRAGKYRKAYTISESNREDVSHLTPLQALSMFVEADLTKRQYEIIRNTNKSLSMLRSTTQGQKRIIRPRNV